VVQTSAGRRRGIAGETVGRLTFDDRVAPYTRVGDLFALACVAASAAMLVAVVVHAYRRRRASVPI